MRRKLCVLALVLALFPTAPRAQEFCGMLDYFVEMAPYFFEPIIMDGDGEFYEVSDWMPDADDCYFDAMDGSYWCVWEVGPSKERSYYINLGRAVRGCYPDWKVENEHDVVFIESDSIGIYISREDGEVAISIESFQ